MLNCLKETWKYICIFCLFSHTHGMAYFVLYQSIFLQNIYVYIRCKHMYLHISYHSPNLYGTGWWGMHVKIKTKINEDVNNATTEINWLINIQPFIKPNIRRNVNSSYAGDRIFWVWWSIPCLLMLWLLKSPEHQQSYYWLCKTENIYCCSRLNSLRPSDAYMRR